jgi:class 3 adenylate cyclase
MCGVKSTGPLTHGHHFQMTYRILTANGQEKWVLEKGIGVFSRNHEPIAVEGFLTDITDRKEIEEALRAEQERSERLLLNILPVSIAEQLKQDTKSVAYRFDEATILFADIVNFTALSAAMPPTELVNLLNEIFSTFDHLAERHRLEKIKTIGDAYMVVGGIPNAIPDHTEGDRGKWPSTCATRSPTLNVRIKPPLASALALTRVPLWLG